MILRSLLALAFLVSSVASAEYVWTPTAKSIFGLLDIEQALEEMQIRDIIDERVEHYRIRKGELEDSLAQLKTGAETAKEAIHSAELTGGETTSPQLEPTDLTTHLTEKTRELAEVKEILGHLAEMELILRSKSFSSLYKAFISELRHRFTLRRTQGDGLKHLKLFVAYAGVLKSAAYEHRTLTEADHRSEFQAFVIALLEQGSALVNFMPVEFAKNMFSTPEGTQAEKHDSVFWIDLKMSRAAKWTAVGCAAAIAIAGVAHHFYMGPAHERARDAFSPFVQAETRGRERHNPADGETAADQAMESAADQALPGLLGK